jgi:hypothetical protein
MWWEPRNDREEALAYAVRQLQIWFREQKFEDQPIAWGFGSAWSPFAEELVPTVLLNSELFEDRLDKFPIDQPPFPIPINVLFRIPATKNLYLPSLEGPLPLHVIMVSRPQPASLSEGILNSYVGFRDPIICMQTGKLGTGAVRVWDEEVKEYGLLTAGHTFPKGVYSPVQRQKRRLWRFSRREYIGRVSHHVVPNGPEPEWDAAVIRLEKSRQWLSPIVGTLTHFRQPEPVIAFGAISGVVTEAAVLQGALVEGGAAPMRWKNCWMVLPSGVLTSGDSGTAVFTRKGDYLGLYVGSSFLLGSDQAFVHYVQDACSLEKEVLSRWHVSFR